MAFQAISQHLPGIHLALIARRPQPAILAVLRINLVLTAEAANFVDSGFGGLANPACLLLATDAHHGQILCPPVGRDAAVAPTGAGTATVTLDDHDPPGRIGLLEPNGRPQPEISSTDDADVSLFITFKRRSKMTIEVKRLCIPEATVHVFSPNVTGNGSRQWCRVGLGGTIRLRTIARRPLPNRFIPARTEGVGISGTSCPKSNQRLS
ncbi:hypothetical protein D9M70_454030 [compost metagenome]